MVFDITRLETFENLIEWQEQIEQNTDQDVVVYLVGNMADLEDERQITREQAIAKMKELDC